MTWRADCLSKEIYPSKLKVIQFPDWTLPAAFRLEGHIESVNKPTGFLLHAGVTCKADQYCRDHQKLLKVLRFVRRGIF